MPAMTPTTPATDVPGAALRRAQGPGHPEPALRRAQGPGVIRADVAIIGAGPAGVAAALRAAELGASVVLLEANRTGGTCVNSGCVPTRVLAKTARLMREVRTAHEFGITAEGSIDWA